MKLTVKTLKGEKFSIEAEASSTISAVKGIIESTKSELAAATMKLIHSGKVLKDEDALEKYGIKENDFLVVMATKAKKAAAAAPPKPAEESKSTETPKPAETSTSTPAPAPAAETSAAPAPSAPSAPAPAAAGEEFPAEVVANLVGLGFPEDMVRHCLRAARGNPDVAVEFLTNGIPPGISAAPSAPAPAAPAPSSGGGGGGGGQPLQALRDHPQFNDLRRLVQSNPQMLQQVLTVIGQQQPELLQEINANQALFLQIMNEPIESTSSSSTSSAPAPSPSTGRSAPSGAGAMGMPADPAQMAQMMQNMDPAQLQMMANMMGLSPEQVQAIGRMIGQLQPEQLQEYMAQAMQSGTQGGLQGEPQVVQLTQEEMAAVDRLTELGFARAEAAQAFLACDKNEALAANFLMDSLAQDSAFSGGGGGDGNSNNNSGGGNNDDNVDDMYD